MVEGTIVSLAKHIEFLYIKNISSATHISNALAYIDSRYVCFTTNSIYYYVIRYINPRIYSIYFAEAKCVGTALAIINKVAVLRSLSSLRASARREGDHRRWWKVQFSYRNAEYIEYVSIYRIADISHRRYIAWKY